MLRNKILFGLTSLAIIVAACEKEEKLTPSDGFGLVEILEPGENATPQEKEIFDEYGVWVRMDWEDDNTVENAFLDKDLYNRDPIGKVDEDKRESAYILTKTFLNQMPVEYVRKNFPLDIFIVKDYGPFWGKASTKTFGRSRLLFTWPYNHKDAMKEVVNPEFHFYQDTIMAVGLWGGISSILSIRTAPIDDFVMAGAGYDNGEAIGKIYDEYYEDYDWEKAEKRLEELAINGGYMSASGSRSFKSDISGWISTVAMTSYEDMEENYFSKNEVYKKKYDAFIEYFNTIGWDIQATGNHYSEMKEKHKLPAEPE